MLEKLLELDKSWFLAINGCNNEFFDHFFFIFTQKEVWIPSIIAILYVLISGKRKEAIWLILALALTITLADQLSSGLLKPLVARLRPSHEPSLQGLVHLINNYTGGRFGFASSHAANSFAVAAFLGLIYKNKRFSYIIIAWAILNSYSRIYVGVHYPLDIIAGALIGIMAAYISFYILKRFRPLALGFGLEYKNSKNDKTYHGKDKIHIISWTLIATMAIIAILNNQLFSIF